MNKPHSINKRTCRLALFDTIFRLIQVYCFALQCLWAQSLLMGFDQNSESFGPLLTITVVSMTGLFLVLLWSITVPVIDLYCSAGSADSLDH